MFKLKSIMQISSSKTQSFGSHLSPKFIKITENTDPKRAELKLAKLGVKADFKGNNFVAACVWQTSKIFRELGLPLPREISVFNDTKSQINGLAQSNFRVKFNLSPLANFKQYDNWRTMLSEHSLTSTGHFLTVFLHEFIHNANFHRISQNKQWESVPLHRIFESIKEMPAPSGLKDHIFNKYHFYEDKNDLTEIFADIMQRRIADSLDADTLMPKSNPFTDLATQGRKGSSNADNNLNQLLNAVYNGDIIKIQSVIKFFDPSAKLPDFQSTPFFIIVNDINKFLQRLISF